VEGEADEEVVDLAAAEEVKVGGEIVLEEVEKGCEVEVDWGRMAGKEVGADSGPPSSHHECVKQRVQCR
jgi:hypothetical protein